MYNFSFPIWMDLQLNGNKILKNSRLKEKSEPAQVVRNYYFLQKACVYSCMHTTERKQAMKLH